GKVSDTQLAYYGTRKDHFFQQIALELSPVPGVIDFITDLSRQGVKLAIATSASQTRTRSTLRRLDLIDHFAVVVTGEDVINGKPDPTIYRLVCTRLNSAARHSLAIEDAVSGVQAAKQAGLKCVGLVGSRCENKLRAA